MHFKPVLFEGQQYANERVWLLFTLSVTAYLLQITKLTRYSRFIINY